MNRRSETEERTAVLDDSWLPIRIRGGRPGVVLVPTPNVEAARSAGDLLVSKRKILVQLDTDPNPSSFDAVVAVDSGVDVLLPYGGITTDNVVGLVHGAIFTRGPKDLHSTAIFVGGSDVAKGEEVLAKVTSSFFGPLRVSCMLDCNGANTTAAAAVVAALRHLGNDSAQPLEGIRSTVLAATGPVGRRVVKLLAGAGAQVRACSRSVDRAREVIASLDDGDAGRVEPLATSGDDDVRAAIDGCDLVVAAGGAGVQLLSAEVRKQSSSLRVAVDLNAVPPEGIEGVSGMDAAKEIDGVTCYGALGVGGIKMKIHKACIAGLFEANDRVLDAAEVLKLGKALAE